MALRKKATAVWLCLLTLLSVAACSGSGGSSKAASATPGSGSAGPAAASKNVTVRMWTFLDPTAKDPRSKVLAQLIKSFEAENPNITIKVEPQPYQKLTTSFLAAAAADNAPDITWTILDDLNTLVSQKLLVDLGASGVFSPADISDFTIWKQMQVNGKGPYGVVMSQNFYGLMYRKDLLAKAGLSASDFSTWAGFKKVVTALNDPSAGINGFGQAFEGPLGDPQIMVPMLLDAQGSPFKADASENWTNAAGASALQYETDLVKQGITPKDSARWQPNDLYDQFGAGRLGVINAASTRVSAMQQHLAVDKVGFAAYPSGGASSSPREFNGWSVGVWSGSKVKDAAIKFVAYMNSQSADKLWATDAGQVPLRRSTLQSATLPDYLKIAAQGIAKQGWRPPLNAASTWTDDLNHAAAAVVLNGQSPSEALKAAAESYTSAQKK